MKMEIDNKGWCCRAWVVQRRRHAHGSMRGCRESPEMRFSAWRRPWGDVGDNSGVGDGGDYG